MEKKLFVSYLRVSTSIQQQSGLGLEGQKTMVDNYIKSNNGILIQSFTEIETGTSKKKRTVIFEAIEYAKKHNAVLCISTISRLARNVKFIASLIETGVQFVCCDMPEANNFTIHLFSCISEYEASLISSRTRIALEMKRKAGFVLGNPANLKQEHRQMGADAMKQKSLSNKINQQATAMIVQYREKGLSYDKIVALLTQNNFMTVNNKVFTSTSVMRLYKRYVCSKSLVAL